MLGGPSGGFHSYAAGNNLLCHPNSRHAAPDGALILSVTPWRGGYLPVRMLARDGLHAWQAA